MESSFRETIFQTFLCLFVIRKVGQRKTLSSQRKHFSVNGKHFLVKRKIWFGFQESVFPFGCVCFPESDFQESVFLENLGGKHFLEVVKNLEMSIFADYIKFDP
jgi:hypothetical protein